MKEFENGNGEGTDRKDVPPSEERAKRRESKIMLWPGLKSEDIEMYRKRKQEQFREAADVPEKQDVSEKEGMPGKEGVSEKEDVPGETDETSKQEARRVFDDSWKRKMEAAERRGGKRGALESADKNVPPVRKDRKIVRLGESCAPHAAQRQKEPVSGLETQEDSSIDFERQEKTAARTEASKPQRKRRERYRVSTRSLYAILGILCVMLVIALVGQEYYMSVTYKKGELAQLAEGKNQQRKRFLTEAATEMETEEVTEAVSQAVTENIAVVDMNVEEPVSESSTGVGAGETLPTEETVTKTVVETSESINLKNQLIGVLPGILPPGQTSFELIAQADRLAAMYDYDGAVELLQNCFSYEQDANMQAAVAEYQASKALCVEYPVDQVTHVFFHTLIKDAEKAFDGDQYEDGYNQYMVTIDEFNSIIQQMYEKGYVMVTLEDMAPKVIKEDGSVSFEKGKILLPEGKIPFVLSQDDVSYYHYMDGDGYASRLIIDENGDVKNEYIEDDGSISVGDYDMVPLIDTFVDAHPDFSYRGAKGYVALTGYDGILGYRTDICYKTRENLTSYQEQFFRENPDFSEADYERECEESKKVAAAMKEDGWLFASHTWGHVGLGEGSTTIQQFKTDTDKWEERVEPLIGETDTIIYAFGGDIGGAADYAGQRFEYLKERGFDYFCGVDSATYWVQIRDNYVRQARRNIDGYRMYYNPDMLSDLFDVKLAWDEKRPATVPPI